MVGVISKIFSLPVEASPPACTIKKANAFASKNNLNFPSGSLLVGECPILACSQTLISEINGQYFKFADCLSVDLALSRNGCINHFATAFFIGVCVN